VRSKLLLSILFLFCFGVAKSQSIPPKIPADSGYFASFDGTKVYYEVYGKGQPVLLVHGFIVNSSSWKRTALFDSLIKGGFQVILIDLRGNGKSDKPHDSTAYDHDAEAKDIIRLISLLKIKSYDVVGYSRGSIITARLLVLDKRVRKAVLGGMGADFTNPNWPRRIKFYHALRGDSVPELQGMVDYVHKQHLDQEALAFMQRSQPSTSPEALGKVKQPVLVISGSEDHENGSAEDLAKLLPHSILAHVPGDHNHASATAELAQKVIAFLNK
jgi:pimeloyl-ACP methyl ester carboxylesterase